MAFQVANNLRFRRSFGRIKKIIDLPYLIEIQKNSYDLFLQKDVSPVQRENIGLQEYNGMLFSNPTVSPIAMNTGKAPNRVENLPSILRTRDLAILLDMSPDAVNDMARKGIVKGYKSGNQWRFRRKDIEKFLEREAKQLVPPG